MWRTVLRVVAGFICIWFIASLTVVQADELEEIERELKKLQEAYDMSVAATTPLESEVAAMGRQIRNIEASIVQAENDLVELEESIMEREVDMLFQQRLLESRVKDWYVRHRSANSWWSVLENPKHTGLAVKGLAYRQAAAERDREIIVKTGEKLKQLAEDKVKLEADTARLAVVKSSVQKQRTFYEGEIVKAKEYQKDLTSKIADLNARQKALLAAKTGLFSTSVGDVPLTGDPASRPDYNPGFSPAFAAFSFGAPHYKGMSQYGAWGRAKSGQNEEQILKAYYGDVRIEQKDLPGTIPTTMGSLDLEANYLMGIAEMPSGWDDNNLAALKAQAIAARTYALVYTGWRINGGSATNPICPTEACQVYNSSKAGNTPSNWRRAVEETRGKVVVSNATGEVFSTMYASTSGGYQESYSSLGHSTPSMWDTTCGNQGCWTAEAYEKKSESPWFYKGWYKTRSGDACNRSHPWLTEEEFADIVNSLIVVKGDGNLVSHLSQVDGCSGSDGETWSKDKVRQEAGRFGGPVSSISGIDVIYSTGGVTSSVKISTDKGTKEFSGSDFKLIFNLRAPGMIHLKSGLFNVEKK